MQVQIVEFLLAFVVGLVGSLGFMALRQANEQRKPIPLRIRDSRDELLEALRSRRMR